MLPNFTPTPAVAHILHALLDRYERRYTTRSNNTTHQALRFDLQAASLPDYHSQIDPAPRQIANEQLSALEQLGWIRLDWLPGETDHLLATVTLAPAHTAKVFTWLKRTPQARQRAQLIDLILADRFRFDDWRLDALQHTIAINSRPIARPRLLVWLMMNSIGTCSPPWPRSTRCAKKPLIASLACVSLMIANGLMVSAAQCALWLAVIKARGMTGRTKTFCAN